MGTQLFGDYGTITDVKIMVDRDTNVGVSLFLSLDRAPRLILISTTSAPAALALSLWVPVLVEPSEGGSPMDHHF